MFSLVCCVVLLSPIVDGEGVSGAELLAVGIRQQAMDLPGEAWKTPNMQAGYVAKLTGVIELIRLDDYGVDDGEVTGYERARERVSRLTAKADGFYGGNPHDDWIVTESGQGSVYPRLRYLAIILGY